MKMLMLLLLFCVCNAMRLVFPRGIMSWNEWNEKNLELSQGKQMTHEEDCEYTEGRQDKLFVQRKVCFVDDNDSRNKVNFVVVVFIFERERCKKLWVNEDEANEWCFRQINKHKSKKFQANEEPGKEVLRTLRACLCLKNDLSRKSLESIFLQTQRNRE